MLNENYGSDTLALVLDGMQDMVYVTNTETYEFIFVNKSIKERFSEAAVGKRCYEVLEGLSEPCSFCGLKALKDMPVGQSNSWPHHIAQSDKWVNVTESLIRWVDGSLVHIVSASDITEVKRQQEELEMAREKAEHNSRVIAEISDHLVSSAVFRTSLCDSGLKLEYASNMLAELTGISLTELYRNLESVCEKLHPEDLGRFRERLYAGFESPTGQTQVFRYVLNGKTMWYKIHARTFIEDGRIIRDGVLVDITADKLREQKLLASRDEALRANEDKSRLMATISHELRNPMNVIIGFMELLSTCGGEIDESTQEDYMRIVSENAHHLLKLVGDVLDISKFDAAQITLSPTHTNLNLLMEDLLSSFIVSDGLQGKDVELELDHSGEDLEGFFMLDASRLRQVLVNLIGNAIKFTEQGYVRFGYSCELGTLRFYVQDSGIGIAQDKIGYLGRPFTQVHDSQLSSKYGGTGLGLAISFNIVKLMGGTFNITSTEGEGTRFEFTIALQ